MKDSPPNFPPFALPGYRGHTFATALAGPGQCNLRETATFRGSNLRRGTNRYLIAPAARAPIDGIDRGGRGDVQALVRDLAQAPRWASRAGRQLGELEGNLEKVAQQAASAKDWESGRRRGSRRGARVAMHLPNLHASLTSCSYVAPPLSLSLFSARFCAACTCETLSNKSSPPAASIHFPPFLSLPFTCSIVPVSSP